MTQAFCERYDIAAEAGANCVIVEAKRSERTGYAACLVLGSEKVDINGSGCRGGPARDRQRHQRFEIACDRSVSGHAAECCRAARCARA